MSASRSGSRRPALAKTAPAPARKNSRRKPPAPKAATHGAKPAELLAGVGAYGFERTVVPILAALVTEDPLLLVGPSGTGKTFLLNSISEALALEHRHYNASLLSFDDLVGFPYPDEEHTRIRFLETPATIWGAESVLVDEISRCKPEHQNRLFSLIHERRVQGLPLERLRYRWAAMNPCTADQEGAESYACSEPLDPALADRFGLVVPVGDWDDLVEADRRRVANPAGEGKTANDGGQLRRSVETWRKQFLVDVERCPEPTLAYVCNVVSLLGEAQIRISPRRARLLCRTLVACEVVEERLDERTVRRALELSLPHAAWGESIEATRIDAAHCLAWDAHMLTGSGNWVNDFTRRRTLEGKVKLLIAGCPDRDTGTLAIEQLIAREPRERAAAFALATYPAALEGKLPIGAEGVNDLGRIASELLTIDGEMRWQERIGEYDTQHPQLAVLGRAVGKLEGGRRERAEQLFSWCLVNGITLESPTALERDFNGCVERVRECQR